ncbi:unnamed protein product [Linum trigynum]|uniref:Uncharacterized protein n=1 Tax=Linum trigynum TaxID=586398 RepID=A0AAV2G2A5_9ROSI
MSAAGEQPVASLAVAGQQADQAVASSPVQPTKRPKTQSDQGFSGEGTMAVDTNQKQATIEAGNLAASVTADTVHGESTLPEGKRVEVPQQGSDPQSNIPISYKDKVMGATTEPPTEIEDEDEQDAMDSDTEGEPDCPTVRFPKGFNSRRGKRWRLALIVRVLGHSFPFLFIQRRLQTMWACTGPV